PALPPAGLSDVRFALEEHFTSGLVHRDVSRQSGRQAFINGCDGVFEIAGRSQSYREYTAGTGRVDVIALECQTRVSQCVRRVAIAFIDAACPEVGQVRVRDAGTGIASEDLLIELNRPLMLVLKLQDAGAEQINLVVLG